MTKTTTLILATTSILAVQANASLFDFYPDRPNIRPVNNIHHTAIDTADHRHGFLNSISAQKHSMVAVGVGGCYDEPGKPCVQKSGGVITVAVATRRDDEPKPPSYGSGDEGDDGSRGYDSNGNYVGNTGEYDWDGSYNPSGGLAGSPSVGGGWGSDGQNAAMAELGF